MLWTRAIKDMEGNIPWQRISPTVLLWLHLLIVALIAMAIARPVLDSSMGAADRVYLVIDSSASMNARVENQSGIERAKEQAIEQVQSLFDSGQSPSVTLIVSAIEPRVIVSDSRERGRLVASIRAIDPTDQPGQIVDAIKLIESIEDARESSTDETIDATSNDAMVWVFTDGGSIETQTIAMRNGRGVTVSPIDEPLMNLSNVGIVAISALRDRADPEMCRVFVKVNRSAEGPKAAVLRLLENDRVITSKAVSFEAQAETTELSTSETFEIRLMQSALIRVELDVDDALDIDDRAWVQVPDPRPIRVTIVAPDGDVDPILVDVFEVIARAPVRVQGPADPIVDADLVVFDRVSPTALPVAPTIGFGSVFPDQSRSDILETRLNRTRMISWDRSDPMLRDSGLGSVSYQRSVRLADESAGVRVLARDAFGSTIVERVQGNNRHVRVCFGLNDSNWVVQVGLPIFLVNAIEQLLPGTSGTGSVFTTSEVIQLETNDSSMSIGPVERAGDLEVSGAIVSRIGVSLLDASESAIAFKDDIVIGSGMNNTRSSASAALGNGSRDLWRWFTLVAIVLIAIEWFLYGKRVRIR